ncbi:MAG: hypothetical protein II089_01945, partial [Selenomonas sp.]|nr:hypothetical protein [Selenomonas sp.]
SQNTLAGFWLGLQPYFSSISVIAILLYITQKADTNPGVHPDGRLIFPVLPVVIHFRQLHGINYEKFNMKSRRLSRGESDIAVQVRENSKMCLGCLLDLT